MALPSAGLAQVISRVTQLFARIEQGRFPSEALALKAVSREAQLLVARIPGAEAVGRAVTGVVQREGLVFSLFGISAQHS
jgi:hypothetical protein